MELIKIVENEKGEKLVSARELHEFLEVKSRFNDWFKNRVKTYELLDGIDFLTVTKNLVNGGKEKDGILKLDVAKELSMVENNEKGREARRYFIEAENKLKNLPVLTEMQMIAKIANNSIEQDKRISAIEYKFENILTIDSGKQRKLQKAIAKRVYFRTNEMELPSHIMFVDIDEKLFKKIKSKMFSGIHRELKNKFGIASYKDVKSCEFEMAISFCENWIENADVRELD